VAWLAAPGSGPPRVAFGITRKVGTATVRNRLRRRIRELARSSRLPAGVWFITAGPGAGEVPFDVLATWWSEAVAALIGDRGARDLPAVGA
jgi:RNase P protein component